MLRECCSTGLGKFKRYEQTIQQGLPFSNKARHTHMAGGKRSTRRPYSDRNTTEAGSTPRDAKNGSVSAPADVTIIESRRFCRIVRLKLAQKNIIARGTNFCQSVTGSGRFASISFRLSAGTCNQRLRRHMA